MSHDKQKVLILSFGLLLNTDTNFVVGDGDWEPDEFRQVVPEGVVVPEKDEEIPAELIEIVAKPENTLPPLDGDESGPKIRRFTIKAENDNFTPKQIIVNENDVVDLSIEAVDKDYDLFLPNYNMRQSIALGKTKSLNFEANLVGRFKFFCPACGGPDKGPSGEIVVVSLP